MSVKLAPLPLSANRNLKPLSIICNTYFGICNATHFPEKNDFLTTKFGPVPLRGLHEVNTIGILCKTVLACVLSTCLSV